jgi:hypothetical protein
MNPRKDATVTTTDNEPCPCVQHTGEYCDGWAERAIAAEALDVERLEQAMQKAAAQGRWAYGDGRVPGFGVVARLIAAEYARLSRERNGQ